MFDLTIKPATPASVEQLILNKNYGTKGKFTITLIIKLNVTRYQTRTNIKHKANLCKRAGACICVVLIRVYNCFVRQPASPQLDKRAASTNTTLMFCIFKPALSNALIKK